MKPAAADRQVACAGCSGHLPAIHGNRRRYCTAACQARTYRGQRRGLIDVPPEQTEIPTRRRGAFRTCPACHRSVWVRTCEAVTWRACSVKCAAALRRHLQPWNQLQQLLIEKMRRDDLTLKDVATSSGVNRTTIRCWFNERDRFLISRNLDKVAAFLGFGLAEAIPLAGGHTGEDEMARTGRANIDAGRPVPGTKGL